MSRIPGDAILRALDANGEPVAGALLRVYIANTTTPVTTYSDRLLTTPQAFPVVANSAGVFPPVYAVSGNLKLSMQTAAGVELPGFPVDNVQNDPGNGLDFAFLSPTVSAFTADGTVGPFTLAGNASATAGMTQVHVAGVRVPAADYTIADDELTFDAGKAPPDGTPVEVISFGAFGADVLVTPVGHEQAALSVHLGEALTGVRTPTLTITGTEVVQSPAVILQRIVALDDFSGTDNEKFTKAVTALGSRGGEIWHLPRIYNFTSDVVLENATIKLRGVGGLTNSRGTVYRFSNGAHALRIRNADGSHIEHMRIEQLAETGRAVSVEVNGVSGTGDLSFDRVRISGGANPLYVASIQYLFMNRCLVIGTAGTTIVVHLDGRNRGLVAGDTGVDNFEAVQCRFAADQDLNAGDIIICDGNVASTKLTNCGILWGQRGIVLRNSNALQASVPKFFYFTGGGFESQRAQSVLIDAGRVVVFENGYASNSSQDSGSSVIRINSGADTVKLSGFQIRAGARHGIDAAGGQLIVSACHIGNNGRVDGAGLDPGDSALGGWPSGVRLAGARSAVITGCQIGPIVETNPVTNAQATISNRQHHAVRFESGQTAPVVVNGNDMRGQQTSSFSGTTPAGSVMAPNLVDA